jgi:hypothetical protein
MTNPREHPQTASWEVRWLDRRRTTPDNRSPLPEIRKFSTGPEADAFVVELRAAIPHHELVVQILRPRPRRREG